jgi:AraC-like DNA-binding protein
MRSVAPSPRLAPFVREFMIVEVREETTRVRLPEAGFVLGVRYRGCASLLADEGVTPLPPATLTAIGSAAQRMRTAANSAIVLAVFHPGGAAQFFSEPLHEFFGTTLSLDLLLRHTDVDRVSTRVMEATNDAQRVAALDALLVARLRQRRPDPVVEAAVRAIRDSHGAVQIRALARQLAISQDPLEKRFRRSVGASPKQLASLLRLRRAIDAYRPGMQLTRLAIDAGYFDQSHFNRDMRAVTGDSPGRFLRSGEYR